MSFSVFVRRLRVTKLTKGGVEQVEAHSDTPKKLGASEIARDWQRRQGTAGPSRAYVAKLIKDKGLPTDSFENAWKWREQNSKNGIGYRSKDASAPVSVTAAVPLSTQHEIPIERTVLGSLQESLAAAIHVEEESLRLVREAQSAKEKGSILESRLRAYNVACKNRSEREAAVREEMERRGILVRMDEAKEKLGRGLRVMIPKLRAMGSRLGVQCNPANPLLAADAIDSEVAAIFAEGELEYAEKADAA